MSIRIDEQVIFPSSILTSRDRRPLSLRLVPFLSSSTGFHPFSHPFTACKSSFAVAGILRCWVTRVRLASKVWGAILVLLHSSSFGQPPSSRPSISTSFLIVSMSPHFELSGHRTTLKSVERKKEESE